MTTSTLPSEGRVEEPLSSEVRAEDRETAAEEPSSAASAEPARVEAVPVEPIIPTEAPRETVVLGGALVGIGNADVQAMVEAEFAGASFRDVRFSYG